MGKSSKPRSRRLPKGLVIIHEDRDILIVDKPPGLLTMGTDREKTRTAYFILTDYVRKGYSKSRNRIFIVHRLDRDTSGILIFAKTVEAKRALQEHWQETEKKYLAVVHGQCKKTSDTIISYLTENKAHVVYVTSPGNGMLAKTAYKVLKQTDDFAMLEIELLTGRKNQARVQLAEIGHAIVGDTKYGTAKKKKGRSFDRLALHARSISFNHPYTCERMTLSAPVPKFFNRLIGGFEAT